MSKANGNEDIFFHKKSSTLWAKKSVKIKIKYPNLIF